LNRFQTGLNGFFQHGSLAELISDKTHHFQLAGACFGFIRPGAAFEG